jgi:hypothetical protein
MKDLLDAGWDYHDKESERLARQLEASAVKGVEADLLIPFLHLSNHTVGQHLGDWPRAFALGKRVLDGQRPTAATANAWGRLHVAAFMCGNALDALDAELSYLKAAEQEVAGALLDMRFMLVDALIGAERTRDGAQLYRAALDLAQRIKQSALLGRSIAATSNNLAWELYESSRTQDEDALMRLAADTSSEYWHKYGNSINGERAHYLKALVANATGSPESGLANADAALAIIAATGARPLDTGLLHLARAMSFASLGDIDGKARAIAEADAAAAKLTAAGLKEQYAMERAKALGSGIETGTAAAGDS